MAYPFYRALKLAYPGHEIHFLVPETLASFSDQEFCSHKLIQSKSAKRFGRPFLQLAAELKKENYEFVVSLTSSLSSSILFWFTRIPVRVGFVRSVLLLISYAREPVQSLSGLRLIGERRADRTRR